MLIETGPFAPGGEIAGVIFNDLNRDSLQNPGEPGVQGIWVYLERGSIIYGTTHTDATGLFEFFDLEPGQWASQMSVQPDSAARPPGDGKHALKSRHNGDVAR